jgi:hypothetical protein
MTQKNGFRVLVVCVALLGVTFSSAGCLFPPVAAPVDLDPLPREGEGLRETPQIFAQEVFQETASGSIDGGLTVQDETLGVQQHVFDLPPRLDIITMVLEWDHGIYDLDLHALLLEDPNQAQVPNWQDNNTEGSLGDPDSPAALNISDRPLIHFETPSQLRVKVTAEAAVDVPYTLTVRATYLVPVETGSA